ncbi:MAG: CHAT domain-containing protein [Bacillota bacterium]|nr:CHAT domain-containing protein [Bacillota bacterium]
MNYEEQVKLFIFNYYIIFKTERLEPNYNPILGIKDIDYSRTTHIWDDELNNIIPALWYVLHLPRMGFDVTEMDIDLILGGHDEPHNIIPFPYCVSDRKIQQIINKGLVNPTLIICEDEVYEEVMKDSTIPKSLLGIVKTSELSSDLLHEQWDKLQTHIIQNTTNDGTGLKDIECNLTNSNTRGILTLLPLANQFGLLKKIMKDAEKFKNVDSCNQFNISMHHRIIELANAVSKRDREFGKKLDKLLKENINFRGVPLVITMPGIMQYQIKNAGRLKELPENEREVVNILGYHRAMAKNALYLNIDFVPQEAFAELAKLEEHCKKAAESYKTKIDNKYIWRALQKIGKILNSKLEQFDLNIIEYVSQITVFSDFPIGLAILPGCSAPLCCIKPIIYRPLTPLTKAFQYETVKDNQVYFGKKCKVIVAECVEKTDYIRRYCDGLTNVLREMIQHNQDMQLVVEEISSINEFKSMLKKHADADILLVSAHGRYNIECNKAGLVIGNDMWMVDDNDISVPPVVLLSACHVSPRGRGVVSVGDLFIRAGAKAVLGTFIPVDVRRNSTLIVRLFTSIIEVRKGWSNMRTLDEIWSYVVCTNAIHEILASDSSNLSKLEVWANTKNESGLFPIAEFKNKYSVGKLRSRQVYEDTEKIIRELAYRDGIGEYFDSVIKSKGYFPESIFYQFIGQPENVFVRNWIFEKYANERNL